MMPVHVDYHYREIPGTISGDGCTYE